MASSVPHHRVRLQEQAQDWTAAIRASAEPLLADGCITGDYVDAIFESFATNGDYMIVVPEVVLAHARPENGANQTGLSLLTLRTPVPFAPNPDKTITAVFTLAAADDEAHLALMRSLAEVLVDDAALARLLTSSDVDEVVTILGGEPR
ncbi:MAG: PTS sugar transporter subunit IIA [Actinotalea sp.]|nr:PTS sugar transporter subunit IIA [Actinotalea sp.]